MTNAQRVTGTRDEHYDLISVLYHTMQEAETLQTYIDDARSAGDNDLAGFFEEVQQQDRHAPSGPSNCSAANSPDHPPEHAALTRDSPVTPARVVPRPQRHGTGRAALLAEALGDTPIPGMEAAVGAGGRGGDVGRGAGQSPVALGFGPCSSACRPTRASADRTLPMTLGMPRR